MSTSIVYACASPRIPSRFAKARARFAPPIDARQVRDVRDDSASRILFGVCVLNGYVSTDGHSQSSVYTSGVWREEWSALV